jgi:type IV pilus assembly protein PilB
MGRTPQGVRSVNLSDLQIDRDVIALVPLEMAERHSLVPINRAKNVLMVAMANPRNVGAIYDVKVRTGMVVEVVEAKKADIQRAISRYYFAN